MEYIKKPMAIEQRSMEIIAPHLAPYHLGPVETKIYSRIIHAAGDVEYAPLIHIHPQAIAAAQEALRGGASIFTDVEMVRTGINKRKLASFGGEVHCLIADADIAAAAKQQGITRSMAAMRQFGAADSKEALRKNTLVPYITVEGTKGGSPIAAAAINALMYDIDDTRF